jgi:hypothetical protein
MMVVIKGNVIASSTAALPFLRLRRNTGENLAKKGDRDAPREARVASFPTAAPEQAHLDALVGIQET